MRRVSAIKIPHPQPKKRKRRADMPEEPAAMPDVVDMVEEEANGDRIPADQSNGRGGCRGRRARGGRG